MTNPSTQIVTRFGLMRHAQTSWNRQKRIQGQTDTPLADTGWKQAASWAAILSAHPWDLLLSSDLDRARSTARALNRVLSLPRHLDARLREQDWGQWVGKTVAALRQEAPEQLDIQERAGWDFCPPGGEDRRRLRNRSRAALIEAAGRWPGKTILTVTHEGVIKSLIYDLLGRDFLPQEPRVLENGYYVHWIRCQGGELHVEQLHGISLGSTFKVQRSKS